MDNESKQVEEIQTLSAIYGEEFQTEDEDNKSYSVDITHDINSNVHVKLYFKLPTDYPSTSPPTFEISAPYLKQDKKEQLCRALEKVYQTNVGETVIFQWIEKIREKLPSLLKDQLKDAANPSSDPNPGEESIDCPKISHGAITTDRKSSFQAHAATVFSTQQVRLVIDKLKENRKVAQAKHNIYAYRIEHNNSIIQDCDDDGENLAGGRLLQLLEIMHVKNVVVVVSRWYGGIHLGHDRFKHINNSAKQVLIDARLISSSEK